MTPLQIVEARAPQFEGEPRIESLLTLAEAQTGADWRTARNMAVALLVLHWLALEERGAAASPGAITSESEGQVSRSYGSTGQTGALSQTSWGQELTQLRRQTFMGGFTRMTLS